MSCQLCTQYEDGILNALNHQTNAKIERLNFNVDETTELPAPVD